MDYGERDCGDWNGIGSAFVRTALRVHLWKNLAYPIDENERQQYNQHVHSNIRLASGEVINQWFQIRCNEHHVNATNAQLICQYEAICQVAVVRHSDVETMTEKYTIREKEMKQMNAYSAFVSQVNGSERVRYERRFLAPMAYINKGANLCIHGGPSSTAQYAIVG